MESLANWLAENAGAAWTTIISFLSVYGVTLFTLVIGIIRTKLAQAKQTEQLNAKVKELMDLIDAKLVETQDIVVNAANLSADKRVQALQEIAAQANAQNSELTEAEEVSTTEALEGLE